MRMGCEIHEADAFNLLPFSAGHEGNAMGRDGL